MRGLREGELVGVARPLHVGRTSIVVQTDLTDAEGRRVAQVTQSAGRPHPAMNAHVRARRRGGRPAAELIDAMRAELESLYGPLTRPSPSATPEELSPPGGRCLVG